MPSWRVYGKAMTAGLVVVVAAVQATLSDDRITDVEGVQITIAAVNAALVYLVPNVPQWPWAKTVLAAGLAMLTLATSLIIDGISSADWSALALAALMAVTGAAPSKSLVDIPPVARSLP